MSIFRAAEHLGWPGAGHPATQGRYRRDCQGMDRLTAPGMPAPAKPRRNLAID